MNIWSILEKNHRTDYFNSWTRQGFLSLGLLDQKHMGDLSFTGQSGGLCLPEHERIKMHFLFLLLFFFWPLHKACGISAPQPEIKPTSLTEDTHNINTGPPGKFQDTLSPNAHPLESTEESLRPLLGCPEKKSLTRTDCFLSQAAASTEGRWEAGGRVRGRLASLKHYLDFI